MPPNPRTLPQRGAAAVLAVLAATGTAQAQSAALQSCRDDARRLCADVRPGGGRTLACLEARRAQLAPACQQALTMLGRCVKQVRQLCDDAEGGPRRVRECLRSKAAELDAECRAALAPR